MPRQFRRINLQEFAVLLERFPFSRKINSIHMHHTWRPNHRQFKGHDTIVGMWRFHTQNRGWSDIAQHITVDPEGAIWLGRNWNSPPASASGHNGNRTIGPFMFEMIGDFDTGCDLFEGKQRETVIRVIYLVQKRFALKPETLRFHNQMSSKSCPGTAIDYDEVLEEVRKLHTVEPEDLAGHSRSAAGGGPFGNEALEMNDWIDSFIREVPEREDPADAEPMEEEMRESDLYAFYSLGTRGGAALRTGERSTSGRVELIPEMLAELRPHVINLNQGQFSSDGKFSTTSGDVDAIFGEHLVREVEKAKLGSQKKLRIVFYAHGGLVSESNALRSAIKHINWWKKNHVYPIYFVWETGLFETIGQILSRAGQRMPETGRRDLWDYTTDPCIETIVRALYGPSIWSAMKRSAELASAPDGGALYAAMRLKEFCNNHKDDIELHAVGHSAGSIFHSHFIPAALKAGNPHFQTVHFMAPAISVDTFQKQLANLIGINKGINKLSLFTMRKDYEEADHCACIYRKSLLYLIYNALERRRETPLLGLEICLRGDRDLSRLFALSGYPPSAGEVIWSVSPTSTGLSASRSTSHGGFDDDPATMNSILRRVLALDEHDPLVEFPEPTEENRDTCRWTDQFDLPLNMDAQQQHTAQAASPFHQPQPLPTTTTFSSQPQAATPGRRLALCVGINEYPTEPLAGCVADALSWADALMRIGFERPVMLLDGQATRDAILRSLSSLVATSKPGDVIVFQYSGHGAQLPDVDGDEEGQDTAGQDEAICPFDFASGAFVIDDDISDVFARIPEGVNVTCFIDCCHSGTITRFAAVTPTLGTSGDGSLRARFLKATPDMIQAHRRFRREKGRGRARGFRDDRSMKEVLFSACNSSEVAWESNGQGEFSTRATRLLRAGITGMTNGEFLNKVLSAFGTQPRQHPELDCAPAMCDMDLLQPLTGPRGTKGAGSASTAGETPGQDAAVIQLLRTILSIVQKS